MRIQSDFSNQSKKKSSNSNQNPKRTKYWNASEQNRKQKRSKEKRNEHLIPRKTEWKVEKLKIAFDCVKKSNENHKIAIKLSSNYRIAFYLLDIWLWHFRNCFDWVCVPIPSCRFRVHRNSFLNVRSICDMKNGGAAGWLTVLCIY